MGKWIFNKKGQNTAEYAILIGLVIAATIGMQTYVKRGLQGRVKNAVDHAGSGGLVGGTTLTFTGDQFDPEYLETNFETIRSNTEEVTVSTGGGLKTEVMADATERLGDQTITYTAP